MVVLYIILAILLLLLAVAGILLFTRFSLIISVASKGITIKISVLGLSFTIPLNKKEIKKDEYEPQTKKLNEEESVMKNFFEIRNTFMRQKNAISTALLYLKGKICLSEMGLIGKFGTGNPATGGMAYGSIYAFVNTIVAFLGSFFVVDKPPAVDIEFKPQNAVMDLKASFLIRAKIIHILIALYKYKNKLKEGK